MHERGQQFQGRVPDYLRNLRKHAGEWWSKKGSRREPLSEVNPLTDTTQRKFPGNIFDVRVPDIVLEVNRRMANEGHVSDQDLLDGHDEIIESDEMREVRQRFFWDVLARVVPGTGFTAPSDRPLHILDIACGDGELDPVLVSYFGENNFGEENGNVVMYGIDNDAISIDRARRKNNPSADSGSGIHYIFGGASSSESYQQITEPLDVVVMTHIDNGLTDYPVWDAMIQQGFGRLHEDGIMLITTYLDSEHDFLLESLRDMGLERNTLSYFNSHAIALRNPQLVDNQYVHVIRKRPLRAFGSSSELLQI